MRKILSILTVIVMIAALLCPVLADTVDTTAVVSKQSPEGKDFIFGGIRVDSGVILDGEGNTLGAIEPGCLVITSLAQALDENTVVAEEVRTLLVTLNTELTDGTTTIPYEKHEADLKAEMMTVRDLFHIAWGCEEHKDMLNTPGVTIQVVLDMGVESDAELYGMVYDEEAKEWTPVEALTNNGDGKVTVTLSQLGAIEFSVVSK